MAPDSESGEKDSIASTDEESPDTDCPPKEDRELLLIKANALKEEGNNYFKENEFEKASRSYRRGSNALKQFNGRNTGDEQVKALLVNLQTNLSMMCLKIGKHKQSAQVASAALNIDSSNVKAMYRRSVANRHLGDYGSAKSDLKQALKLDPTNAAVKKELSSLKKAMDESERVQKQGLRKAFSKGGLGMLYEDKENEKQRKENQAELKKQQEEEFLKKRKSDWEDECVKRMAKGEDAASFEKWDEERNEREKTKARRDKEVRRQACEATMTGEVDSDDSGEALTETELSQLRGYKKTSDGRMTSYFTREQTVTEKDLIGDIAPKRLDSSSSASKNVISKARSEGEKGISSAWNQAGTTWEEKDTTPWCQDQLKDRLLATSVDYLGLVTKVTGIDGFSGEASVAIASGKKLYIFDFHCDVKFEVRDQAADEVLAIGSLVLPDICSTHHHELDITWRGWKRIPATEHEGRAVDCKNDLVAHIRKSVKLFVDDFNEYY